MVNTAQLTSESPVLEARSITKTFGGVHALDNASLQLYSGVVTALLGDNGAGKTTLVNVISGVHQPDGGQVILNGTTLHMRTPHDALSQGVACVYQDLALVDTLDVARNIYLSRVPRRLRLFVDYGKLYADAERVLRELRFQSLSVRALVSELSGGQRQGVAIGRALAEDAQVVLLDEPTAALGIVEQEKVNELILELKNSGRAVMVISHNLEHVFRIADRVVVLRHGRCVGTRQIEETTREEVVGLITGAMRGDIDSEESRDH